MPSVPGFSSFDLVDIHDKIARDYERIFEQDGYGRTDARIDLLRAVLRREGHFTVEEIIGDLRRAGRPMESGFASETLESFVHYGLVWAIRTDDQPVRYEHVHLLRHHDHVICVRCGRISEIDLPMRQWPRHVEQTTGFRILQGQTQLRGLCPQCLSGRPAVFALSSAGVGEELHVVGMELEGEELKRLTGMGLRKGARVEVLCVNSDAGAIIAVDQSRIAVNRGVMERVSVRAGRLPEAAGRRGVVPLTGLGVGRSGRIVRVCGHGPTRHRLLEMGITRGATVFVERVAPLGDPIEVTVKGYYLAIRKEEASRILVEP
ncbi:MAG: FeoA domain-containing protein [Phycisphaerales bacterium]|nr:MAG: FeoA domain-containing protein [Phycisphaerales bacterium]